MAGVTTLAALAGAGCAARTATGVQASPLALEIPAPPPRVVVPPEPEAPEPPPAPAGDAAPAPKAPRRPQPAPPRSESRPEAARPALPAPAPTLEQALPASPSDMVRRVREQLNLAQRDLDRVDYTGLDADRRAQYDTAKRFVAEAEQALRDKNLVYAAKVAEKAAGLAASLASRLDA
jgi:2-oxoglutarate dehydrogenase E2 component (dihydrolipoamide succinyltransferase)